jgi:hypothetical protein
LDFIAEIDRVDDSESVRLLFQRFLEVEIGFTNVVCLKVPNAAETLNSTIYFNTRSEACPARGIATGSDALTTGSRVCATKFAARDASRTR